MSEQQGTPEEHGVSVDHEDLVMRLWQQIWIDNDLDRITDLVADPYVRHTRDGTISSTPAGYARHVEKAIGNIRSTGLEVDDISSEGDKVYAHVRVRGINLTTGDGIVITWLAHYRIHDGRVAESWSLHQTGLDW